MCTMCVWGYAGIPEGGAYQAASRYICKQRGLTFEQAYGSTVVLSGLRLFYGLMISCETDGHESKPSSKGRSRITTGEKPHSCSTVVLWLRLFLVVLRLFLCASSVRQ